jgi:hypothetical protein
LFTTFLATNVVELSTPTPKCPKISLRASIIPNFFQGNTPEAPLKGKEGQEEGNGKGGEEVWDYGRGENWLLCRA